MRRHWPQAPCDVVDDLAQETYLKLCAEECRLLRQFKFRGPESIYGFLKVVAASVVLDHLKSQLARKRDASQTETLSDDSSPDRLDTGGGSRLSMEDQVALRQIDEIVSSYWRF